MAFSSSSLFFSPRLLALVVPLLRSVQVGSRFHLSRQNHAKTKHKYPIFSTKVDKSHYFTCAGGAQEGTVGTIPTIHPMRDKRWA